MKKNSQRTRWSVLYLLTVLYLVVFWFVLKADFSETGRIWAEASLTCVYFGLVLAWLKANEMAMWLDEQEKHELPRKSRESFPDPEREWRTISSKNGNSQPEHATHQWFSRLIPTWFIALFSHLGEIFKGFH